MNTKKIFIILGLAIVVFLFNCCRKTVLPTGQKPPIDQVINPITVVDPLIDTQHPVNPVTGLWDPALGDYTMGSSAGIEVDHFNILDENGSIVKPLSQEIIPANLGTPGKLIVYLAPSVSLEELAASPKLLEMIFKTQYPKINLTSTKPLLINGVITASYTVSLHTGPIHFSQETYYELIILHEIQPEDTEIEKIEGINQSIATEITVTHGKKNDGNIVVNMASGVDPENIFASLASVTAANQKPVSFLSLLAIDIPLGQPGNGKYIFLRNKKAFIRDSFSDNSIIIRFGSNENIAQTRIYKITYITK